MIFTKKAEAKHYGGRQSVFYKMSFIFFVYHACHLCCGEKKHNKWVGIGRQYGSRCTIDLTFLQVCTNEYKKRISFLNFRFKQ